MRFSLSPSAPVDGDALLPLAAAKAHLRVLNEDEDDLILALRNAALDAVQQYTGKRLLETAGLEWRGRFASTMQIGVGPLASIQSISYLNVDGVPTTLTLADYARIGVNDTITLLPGKSWPETVWGDGAVTISFTAGYAAGEVPPSLLAAARLFLGHLFSNREAVIVGQVSGELSLGFMTLCQPYRQVVL